MKYYTYIIRCSDNSLYTGITNDLNKRIYEHFTKDKRCAKYTKSHDVIRLEAVYSSCSKSLAAKLEYYIKRLKKKEKEDIIYNCNISKYLSGKVDCRRYKKINISSIK